MRSVSKHLKQKQSQKFFRVGDKDFAVVGICCWGVVAAGEIAVVEGFF